MSKQISSLWVGLTGNVSGLAGEFGKAIPTVQRLGGAVRQSGAGIQAGFGVASLAAKGFMASVAPVAAALAPMVAAFAAFRTIKGQFGAVDDLAKLSDRLGIATEAMAGLQHAGDLAGVGNDELASSLGKMLKSLADAAGGGKEASEAYRSLGLDAGELVNMAPDAAFGKVADALKAIDNPAQRAAAAVDVFGKAGGKLLPLMMGGAEGLAEARAEAEKLGLTVSRVDAAKIEMANDSMTRIGAAFTGAGRQLAVQFAPYLDAAASKLVEMATEGEGIGPKVADAFEWVASAVAKVADVASLAASEFHFKQAVILRGLAGLLGGVDKLGSGVAQLLNLMPGVEVKWTDSLANMAAGLEMEAAAATKAARESYAAWEAGANEKAVTAFFADIRRRADEAAAAIAAAGANNLGLYEDLDGDDGGGKAAKEKARRAEQLADALRDVAREASAFGLGKVDAELAKLKELGADAGQLATAGAVLRLKDQLESLAETDTGDVFADFGAKLEGFEALLDAGKISLEQFKGLHDDAAKALDKSMRSQADSLAESVRTPLEAYDEQIKKLQQLREHGGISEDLFGKAAAKAKESLTEAFRTPAETLEKEMEHLRGLFDRGLISNEAFERSARKARETYHDALKDLEPKRAKALRVGSAEAELARYGLAQAERAARERNGTVGQARGGQVPLLAFEMKPAPAIPALPAARPDLFGAGGLGSAVPFTPGAGGGVVAAAAAEALRQLARSAPPIDGGGFAGAADAPRLKPTDAGEMGSRGRDFSRQLHDQLMRELHEHKALLRTIAGNSQIVVREVSLSGSPFR